MRSVLLLCTAALLTGCGYVGDPLPPALNIPEAIENLRVVQRGDKLVIDFTAPALTTEEIGLTSILTAEARMGADVVPLDPPKPGAAAHFEVPAKQWTNREVPVMVVLGGPKGQRSKGSNTVTLRVEAPLEPPAGIKAEPHPEGVRVAWTAQARANRYRVTRVPEASVEVDKAELIDRAVELGKEYRYVVTALRPGAESLPSAPASVTPRDVFPPTVPTNVTAVLGVGTVELAWDRSPEADLKSYRVYRNDQLVGGEVEGPAFSDRMIQTGQQYRYAIAAVDTTGNESARSAIVEVTAP
jgi:hypothetical protein